MVREKVGGQCCSRPTNSFPAYLIMIRWAERGLPGGRNYSWPSQARTPKKKSLMPQTILRAERVEKYYAQPSANRIRSDFADGGDDEPSHLAASVPAGGGPPPTLRVRPLPAGL